MPKSKKPKKKSKKTKPTKSGKKSPGNNGDIQALSSIEQVYMRPGMWIGGKKCSEEDVWVMRDDGTVECIKMVFNRGMVKCIGEPIENVLDNKSRTIEKNGKDVTIKMTRASIDIAEEDDMTLIVIENDGAHISTTPQTFHIKNEATQEIEEVELYPAEAAFGRMFSGRNYEGDRTGIGMNGVGVKATSIFSKYSRVEHYDPYNKEKFTIEFIDNMKERSDPVIESLDDGKIGWTRISFALDLKYFKFPSKSENYLTSDLIDYLRLKACEISMLSGIKVSFNGEKIKKITNLEKYTKLFFKESRHKLFSLRSPLHDDCVVVQSGVEEHDVVVAEQSTPNHISFVNGTSTRDGGIHVTAWAHAVVSRYVRGFNEKYKKKGKTEAIKTTARQVYPFLTFVVNANVVNPRFKSQTKDDFVSMEGEDGDDKQYLLFEATKKPTGKSKRVLHDYEQNKAMIDEFKNELDEQVKKMLNWPFTKDLVKRLRKLKPDKKRPRKKDRIYLPKLQDANKAGQEPEKCTIYIMEGDSAKSGAMKGFTNPDYQGAISLKGKPPGTTKNTIEMVEANASLASIKTVLNLTRGLDYGIKENLDTLRYHTIYIMTDADDDGIHIRGLLLDFFYTHYRSLIENGHVRCLNTGVVEVQRKKGDPILFYTKTEFDEWKEGLTAKMRKKFKWPEKYNKGLGSIDDQSIGFHFDSDKINTYTLDDEADDYMDLCFAEAVKRGGDRKNLVTIGKKIYTVDGRDLIPTTDVWEFEGQTKWEGSVEFDDAEDVDYKGELGLSTFVRSQMIEYYNTGLMRGLFGIDGLKDVWRKIYYSVQKQNRQMTGSNAAGCVQGDTEYHHADAFGSIITMGQNYAGSPNNVPLIRIIGSSGSRIGYDNGKASKIGGDYAASRYVDVAMNDISKHVFKSIDNNIIPRHVAMIKGKEELQEPKYLLPVILLSAVNGRGAPACGHASNIYNVNPEDLVDWTMKWIDGEDTFELHPWWAGLNCDIEFKRDKDGVPISVISTGVIEKGTGEDKGKWLITELPVYVSTGTAKKHLEAMCEGKGSDIVRFDEYHTAHSVLFKITMRRGVKPDLEFKRKGKWKFMRSSISINITILDENYLAHKFPTMEAYLEWWCTRRLFRYGERKDWMLDDLELKLQKARNKYRFIRCVLCEEDEEDEYEGKPIQRIELYNEDDEDDSRLHEELEELEFERVEESFEYLLGMQMRSMTKKRLENLLREVEKIIGDIEEIGGTSPGDMWKSDLDDFLKAYKKMDKDRTKMYKNAKKRIGQ